MKPTVTFTLKLNLVAGNQSSLFVSGIPPFPRSLLFIEKFSMCFQFHLISKMRYRIHQIFSDISAFLCEKCPYPELFWFVFSRIRTEYGEILRISPYSVQMQENMDQNNSEYGHFLRSVVSDYTWKAEDSYQTQGTWYIVYLKIDLSMQTSV